MRDHVASIYLTIRPISFNNAYSRNKSGRRFLKREAKDYKHQIRGACESAVKRDACEYDSFEVYFTFGIKDGLTKGGKIKRRRHDYDGFIKLCQDACFDALEVDDSLITEATIQKIFSEDCVQVDVWGRYII